MEGEGLERPKSPLFTRIFRTLPQSDLTANVKLRGTEETPRGLFPRLPFLFDNFKIRQRVREVEEAMERVERHLKTMELEWSMTLDKLKTLVGRVTKDRERAEKAREAFPPEADEAALVPSQDGGLSERQMQINASILARRKRTQ